MLSGMAATFFSGQPVGPVHWQFVMGNSWSRLQSLGWRRRGWHRRGAQESRPAGLHTQAGSRSVALSDRAARSQACRLFHKSLTVRVLVQTGLVPAAQVLYQQGFSLSWTRCWRAHSASHAFIGCNLSPFSELVVHCRGA